jgi:hypothetical protein
MHKAVGSIFNGQKIVSPLEQEKAFAKLLKSNEAALPWDFSSTTAENPSNE